MIPAWHDCFGLRVGLLLLGGWLSAAPALAQERAAPVPSLRWVPADAGAYSAMLRNREQLEAVLGSKAWARLMSLPVVQMGRQMLAAQWDDPNGPLAQLKSWYDQPGNAELVHFIGELFEEEVFSYAGKNAADVTVLLQEVQTANQLAPLMALIKHGPKAANQPEMRAKVILQLLAEHPERIKVPDLVMGFKLSRTRPAQVAKWMESVEKFLTQSAPPLRERMKTIKISGADAYTLVLDGAMIPWEAIPLDRLEDRAGELDNLVKRLKETKLTIAVTVRGNYLLLGLGADTAGLAAVGADQPKRLSGRQELAALSKFADRRLTAVNYISKEFAQAMAKGHDPQDLTSWIGGLLKDAGLPADKQAQIINDVKGLTADLKRLTPQPGASLTFSFLTKNGSENYTYDWAKNSGMDGSKPLNVLTHVGGQPLGFAVSRQRIAPEGYELLARQIKLGHKYFEEFALPQLPPEVVQIYEKFMDEARPLFKRLDHATGKLLLPALDGQSGIVLDAKMKSKQWQRDMPPSAKDLPLPDIAIILGVRDAAKLREAFQEYRAVYNGLVDAVTAIKPDLPDVKLAEPKAAKQKGGTIYWYPLPAALGLDQRLAPAAGLSEKIAVFTLSPFQAQQLLKATLLKKMKSGPLSDPERPLASANYFDWAGLVDAITPWIDYGLAQAHQNNEVTSQVQSFLEILKVWRGYASATYLENGVLVTHGESIVRDLAK